MTLLYRRRGFPGAGRGSGSEWPSHWRAVPVINVLSRPSRRAPRWSPVRVGVGAVVLLELIWILVLVLGWQGAKGEIEEAEAALESVKAQRAAELQEINDLKQQVEELEAEAPAQESEILRVAWGPALAGLFEMDVPGIVLDAVSDQPEDPTRIVINGVASDLQAMARFQSELRNMSNLFDLQSIQWEASDESLSFTVVMRLSPRESDLGAG